MPPLRVSYHSPLVVSAGPWTGNRPSTFRRPSSRCAPISRAASRSGSRAGRSERQYERILEARLRDEAPALRPARRPALRDRRHPLRHRAQQGAEGHRRPVAAADGQARACSGRAGTATACRSSSRSRRSWARTPGRWTPRRSAQRCEEHALKFVDVMRTEFKRLGCLGNWDDPYLTLAKDYEATIARQLAGFVARGAGLPRQEAGALVPRPPHRAGRGGGRVRRPRLASAVVSEPRAQP